MLFSLDAIMRPAGKMNKKLRMQFSSDQTLFIRVSISEQNPCKSIWRLPRDLCKLSTFGCCRILSHVVCFRSELGSRIHCRSASKDAFARSFVPRGFQHVAHRSWNGWKPRSLPRTVGCGRHVECNFYVFLSFTFLTSNEYSECSRRTD